MLNIKTGVAVHVDYSFRVLENGADSGNAKTYTFVDNELTTEGLLYQGKDIVLSNALFGTSDKVAEDFSSVLVPIKKVAISKLIPANVLSANATAKTMTVQNTVTFEVSGFNLKGENKITLREFSLENLSRLILKDPYQELNGLNIGAGDKVEVTLVFTYTYYTNNKTSTLGADVFGERVDYTSEIVKLKDMSINSVRINPGYASTNPIDILPIDKDIRSLASNQIYFPVKNDFQKEFNKLNEDTNRLDLHTTGYYPTATLVYGFILRDNVRGMGVLVRFLQPVLFEREKRYEVEGYIQWTRKVGDFDDGYTTIDFDTVTEEVPLVAELLPVVTVPTPTPDVAIEITSIQNLKLALDRLGLVVDLTNVTTWAEASTRLKATNLFEEVELLSNRVGNRLPSLFQYNPPSAEMHVASILEMALDPETGPYIYPSLIAGGDYSLVSASNNIWRWDCYFPYFGDMAGVQYVPYAFAGYLNSKATLDSLPDDVKESTTITTRTVGGVTDELTVEELITHSGMAGTIPGLVSFKTIPVEGTATRLIETEFNSDFDTSVYDDWIPGKTQIQLNAVMMDLRTTVESDNRKNVTSFNIIINPERHNVALSQVWINGQNYGRLDQITPEELELVDVKLVVEQIGATTKYTFTRPFEKESSEFIDIYFIGNEYIYSNGREVGYLTLENGTHGFRVYNAVGSDVSNSLYALENPFLMAGVKLFQPIPDYLFKYRILTATEARVWYNDNDITTSLNPSLFTTDFADNVFSVFLNDTLNWQDPNLNSAYLYPAIGIDLTRIGENLPMSEVIMVDGEGKEWTKQELLESPMTMPEKVIDNTLYFVTPFKLVEGNQQFGDQLDSTYYDQSIQLQVSTTVALDYPLDSAVIDPNPMTIISGRTAQATYTYLPVQATITSAVWSTINTSIATVNEYGLVTAVAPGTTTLRLVLNERVIATAAIIVTDPVLIISCDGAENITTCLDITGTQVDIEVNDTEVVADGTTAAIYNYFRDNENFRIVNCSSFTAPAESESSETNFLSLTGTYDLWLGGTLVGKDLTEAQIKARLAEDGRFEIIDGEQ